MVRKIALCASPAGSRNGGKSRPVREEVDPEIRRLEKLKEESERETEEYHREQEEGEKS